MSKYVEKFPKTIEALKAAGINYTLVLQDGIHDDGYEVIGRDENGVRTPDGHGGILKTFVPYSSPAEAEAIWGTYKREIWA